MKNYFESDKAIIPFEKVIAIFISGKYITACYAGEELACSDFDISQLANYKAWLDSQSNTSEIPTSCSCSEKDTSRDFVLTRMQAKSVLSVLESIAIQKNTALEDAYNVLKDRLGSVAKLYQSQFTCSEKANNSNHLPDVGKMVLNKKQVTMVYREINYPNLCAVCINFNDESDSRACMKCDENSSEFKVSDFYVKKFNYLINEVQNGVNERTGK